jgi:hypothetical protein
LDERVGAPLNFDPVTYGLSPPPPRVLYLFLFFLSRCCIKKRNPLTVFAPFAEK